jgi:hypothetical protein
VTPRAPSVIVYAMIFTVDQDFRPMGERERVVLTKLFAHDFPGRAEVERQCADARVKIVDAEGSFAIDPISAVPLRPAPRIAVEARYRDDGRPVSDELQADVFVLLHVVKGRVTELEIFKADGSEIRTPAHLAEFQFW